MGRFVVRDIMVTEVVTLRPGDSVEVAVRLLLDRQVGGVPVLAGDGRLVGLLSDADLVIRQGRLHIPTIYTLFHEPSERFPSASLEAFATELRKALGWTVGEVMDPQPLTCQEEEFVEDVATRMLDHGASRVPVVRDGRLVGIVARADLLRLLVGYDAMPRSASTWSPGPGAGEDDISGERETDPVPSDTSGTSPDAAGQELLAL